MYTKDELLKKRAELSASQRALVQQRIRRENTPPADNTALARRPPNEPIPPSFVQQRLWFLQQLTPESTAYNELIALHLDGVLNREALEQSIHALVRRHEILRTTFPFVEDAVRQVIAPEDNLKIEIPFVHLQTLPPEERETHVRDWTNVRILRPFSLEEEWPWRTCVLCLGEREHIFLVCMHHSITDAWSLELFVTELMALYRSCCTGQPSTLADLPFQYADYTFWQRQTLTEERLNGHLDYWRGKLGGPLPILELQTDHPRPTIWTNRGRRQTWRMPEELYRSLRQWSRQENATLFMVLLAAFNALLYRYTMQEDIILGTSIAGRLGAELEHMLGCFVNNLALRTDLSGDPTFRELVKRVRSVALEAYEHQELPFEKIVEELRPARDLGRSPIFQILLVLQNMPMATIDVSDLDVKAVEMETTTTRFDLTLILQESSDGVHGYIEYNSDLFEAETIARLMEQYQRMLTDAIAHPERRIADLLLLSPADEQRMLVDWNATRAEYPLQQTVHQLFAEQVARTPDAAALVYGMATLTYRELQARSNQLARVLQAHGVGAEALVGIYMERSPEVLIAILATFKAGGAYVPLDAAYPAERLAFVLQDACPKVIVTQSQFQTLLPAQTSTVIVLDQVWQALGAQSSEDLTEHSGPEHLAYVLFTSGSTGRPKGAMIHHRGMLNHIYAKACALGIQATDRIAQSASLCFDVSVWQFFSALLLGAQVHILPDEIAGHPQRLWEQVLAANLTIIEQVPSFMRALLDTVGERIREARQVRWMVATGETLPLDVCRRWLQAIDVGGLVNSYGSTECSDDVAHFVVDDVDALCSASVPLGRPLANIQLYVLDARLAPVPIGVPGQVYVGGVAVGRGYLADPARTAAVFLPDPFSGEEGARLYKMGDLARYLPDGTLEFLGRVDHQMKVRGFRIEPGEIEALLHEHPQIRESVVLLYGPQPDQQFLVAYAVPEPLAKPSAGELRQYLKERLPEYMVPAVVMLLPGLPLTPNGKIDRRALPAPDQGQIEPGTNMEGVSDPVTELVGSIWSQVLRRERIGLSEEFFALGGHSLLAIQVVSRVRATFGVELPLQTFFLSATISAQAAYIRQALQETEVAPVPPLAVGDYERPLPLSFTQQRQWLLDQMDPDSRLHTIFGAVRLGGPLRIAVLEQSLGEIIRRHAILRTVFLMHDEELVQVIKAHISLPFHVLNFSDAATDAQEAAVNALAAYEQGWSFDLAQGPLLRMTVICLGETDHVLMLACHHILLDGWSLQVLLNELATLYVAFAQEEPSPLPELPVQYADYARWQREVVRGSYLEQLLAYWTPRLTALPVFVLPSARARPQQKTFRAARLPVYLPEALTTNLKALCRREGVTLFMALLAAFQATLARYSGQDDIVVGTPIANRNRTELEPLLGNFINTLVLRTDLSGNPTFCEALRRIREVALGAYAHQDLPFEKLMQELHPERDLDRNPLFQVLFAFQNIPEQKIELPGLTANFLQSGGETTVFDLDLTMWEREGELVGGLKYNTDLFDEPLIRLMRDDLLALLELMATDVQLRIADRSRLAEDEQLGLQRAWNATSRVYEREATMHQLFERQVERAPGATAVVFEDQTLTYQQLNEQANQLAHHLRMLRIGPGSMVAIVVERSLEMIPALLAVLKAGACYVPLEPDFPEARIQWILSSLQIRVVVTQSPCLNMFSRLTDLPALKHIICLDSASEVGVERDLLQAPMQLWTRQSLLRYSRANPGIEVPANALAYVIFTSGSTGQPKGVMVRHQPVVNLIEWVNRTFAVGATDRVLFVTSLCFDLSVYDIFGLLAAGGSLQVVASSDLRDPERLLKLLAADSITFWDSAPAALQMLPLAQQDVVLRSEGGLRLVFLSGDWIPIKLPDQVRAAFPAAEVVSLGGATEATVWSNFFRVGEVAPEWVSIPYGRPIQNASYHILDAYLNPRPLGVPGDLYIGGECLASGYIGEPELTAQKFIPSPFSEEPGMRLYKTGDLARYWPDGVIEFLGRSDTQVKVRGFRIELGEVEATLSRHPDVQVAIADARRDTSGEKSLVAYVVPRQERTLSPTELRVYLQSRLPAYMLPSSFILLDALPVTANGKVDRQRLPELATTGNLRNESAYVAPRTPIEEQMAALWIDALKLSRLSIHDDFFMAGGHSLLAVQLVARIRSAWHIALPLRDLFTYPTVAALSEHVAASIRSEQAGEGASDLVDPERPWYEDAVLAPDFPEVVLSGEPRGALQHIFLTNATGVLGSPLLEELLRKTAARVSCLVRGQNEAEGLRRIRQALERDALWRDEFASRIVPVCGDLGQPRLGLTVAAFERLAAEIDCIYHNGALFSNVLSYEDHRDVNVQGAREILKLACLGEIKPIHYVSTIGVLSSPYAPGAGPVMEGEALESHRDVMVSGYDRSKWCAEKIMRLACERGMPITFYRPGRLTGHSQTGAWRVDDLVCRQIKGCIQLGGAPDAIFGDQLEMTPVDYVSRAIVALSLQPDQVGKAYHLLSSMNISVEQLSAWINEFGYPVERQTYRVWRDALQQAVEQHTGNVLAPFLESYPEWIAEAEEQAAEERVIFDDRQTQAALAGTFISCPPIDRQLIHNYLAYFVKIGFLPAPQH